MEAPLKQFIESRPHLVWYVKDRGQLSPEAIVEQVLNYGTWKDVQELLRIMGQSSVEKAFQSRAFLPRSNYRPEIRHYFNLYFQRHAA